MLLKLRKKLKLTQSQMAERFGIRQGAYCKFEKEKSPFNLNIIKKLRTEFKVNINKLIDNNEL